MKIKSHYIRSNAANVNQGVSRAIEWQGLRARVEFIRDGKQYSVTFDDDLDERLKSDRLNSFLEPRSDTMKTLVEKAVRQVLHHRTTDQPNAALLYIAKNINHAKAIGDLIYDTYTRFNHRYLNPIVDLKLVNIIFKSCVPGTPLVNNIGCTLFDKTDLSFLVL